MSNKFNEFGSGESASVTNGSLDIYGFSLKAENLDANQPLKTNSDKQLVSTQLNISDVVNLQAELDSSIQNPNQSILVTDGVEIANGNDINFTSDGDITGNLRLCEARVFRNTTVNANDLKRIKTASIEQEVVGVDILQAGTDFSGNNISGVGTLGTTDINMTGDLTNAVLVEARVFRNTTTNANELKAIKTGFLIQEIPGVDIQQQGTDFGGSNISGVEL